METLEMDIRKACELLQISESASKHEVESAFRKIAKLYHPDKCKDPDSHLQFYRLKKSKDFYLKHICVDLKEKSNNQSNKKFTKESEQQRFELKLTLEEIFSGCIKKEKINIKKFTSKGNQKSLTKKVKVTVTPGSIEGTRITIAQKGDKYYGKLPENTIFIVREQPHSIYKRNGYNLEYIEKVSAEKTIFTRDFSIPTIDNQTLKFSIDKMVTQNTVIPLANYGLPIRGKENGKRGALLVRFEIVYESTKLQDPQVEHEFSLSLEQMFKGCIKRFKICRSIVNDPINDFEEKIFTIEIPPGVLPGTRFVYEKEGNRYADSIPADLCFIVQQKPDPNFIRNGQNLYHTVLISKLDIFGGGSDGTKIEIPALENKNEKLYLKIEKIFQVDSNKIFPGKGFPCTNFPDKRGDLIVNFKLTDKIDPLIRHDLALSLEEILKGCEKKMIIKRLILDSNGNGIDEGKIVTVNITPGTKAGTRFTFSRMGDQNPDSIPADIVYIVRDKPHDVFRRIEADVEYSVNMKASEFQEGKELEIPTLENKILVINLNSNDLISLQRKFKGKGLHLPTNSNVRGDLVVKFEIIEDKEELELESQPNSIEYHLYLTEKQLQKGCTKRMRIERSFQDEQENERIESKMFEIVIQPGTDVGTKFAFKKEGNVRHGMDPDDIVFVVQKVPT